MSLVYKLLLSEEVSPDTAFAAVEEVSTFERHGDGLESHDLLVTVARTTTLDAKVTEEEFGFPAQSKVLFRLIKNRDPIRARDRMIRCCAAVLARTTCDAALLFNSEVVILLRKSGRLIANELPGFWTREMLTSVGGPEMRPMRGL